MCTDRISNQHVIVFAYTCLRVITTADELFIAFFYCVPDKKMLRALIVVALLVPVSASCAGDIMENRSSKKTKFPSRLRLNSVGESSDTSNSPEVERKKERKRRLQTNYKPKNPQKNAREKKRVEAVATAYKQLRTALGAGDENRRRSTKVETLQAAVKFIHDLTEELAGLQLLQNEPSDGVYPVATEPSPTVQANLVRICARRCMHLQL